MGSVYKQPETEVDDSLSQLGGCQVSRRGYKGETKRSQQGERKSQGNCAMYIQRAT
jgi:hypothetical protein